MKKHISVLLALVMLFSLASALPAMAREETLLEQWVNGDSESAVMARFWFPDAGAGYDADGDGRGDYIDQVESMILDMCEAGFGGCELTMLLDSTDFGVLSQEQYDALGFSGAEDAISKLGWGTASWANIIACAADTANRYNRENGTDFHVDVTITAHWPMIINSVAPNDPEQQQQLVYTVQAVTADMLQNGADLALPTMKTEDEANSAAMTSTYIFTDTLVASTLVRASDSAEQSASGETASASGEASGEASGVSYDFSSLTDMTASVEAREGRSAGVPKAGARYMRLEDGEWAFYETAGEIDPSYADADDYVVLQKGTNKLYEPEHELSVAVTINFVTSYTVTDKTTGEVVASSEYDLIEKGSVVSYYTDDDGDPSCKAVEVPELLTIQNRHFFGDRDEMADRQMLYSVSGEALRGAGAAEGEYYLINTYRRGTGQVASGGGNIPMTNKTYAVDYFSSAGAQKVIDYWEENLLPHEYIRADGTSDTLRDILEENGATIFEDSIELSHTDGILWTANMLEELAVIGGVEDAAKYMPVFAGLRFDSATDADGLQTRLSQALKITMNELYCREHLGTVGEWTESFNYQFRTQCHGIDAVDSGAAAFAAGIAESDNATDGFGTRAYAGAKNVNPDNNVISNESLTFGTGFGEFPSWYYAENTLNRYYSEGVNRVIYHGTPFRQSYTKTSTANSEWPGWDFMSFMAWNSRQTWWDDVDVFTGYTNRIQAILQNGDSKIPVAVLENAASSSVTGLNRGVGISKSTMQELIGRGYNYSILTKGVLEAEGADLAVVRTAQGELVLSEKAEFQVLVLDHIRAMSVEAMEKLLEIAEAGLPIVDVGSDISAVYGMESDGTDADIAALYAKIQALDNYYYLADETELIDRIADLATPWVSYENASSTAEVDAGSKWLEVTRIHDDADGAEYYMFYNESGISVGAEQSSDFGPAYWNENGDITARVTLRGEGVPYWLDPASGAITAIADYEAADGTVSFDLSIAEGDLLFVMLSGSAEAAALAQEEYKTEALETIDLSDGDWTLALTAFSADDSAENTNDAGVMIDPTRSLRRTITLETPLCVWAELALDETQLGALGRGSVSELSGIGVYTQTVTLPETDGALGAVLHYDCEPLYNCVTEVRVVNAAGEETVLRGINANHDWLDLGPVLTAGENTISLKLCTDLTAAAGSGAAASGELAAQSNGLLGAALELYTVR